MRVLLYVSQRSTFHDWYACLPSIIPLIHSLHSCQSAFWNSDMVASRLRLKAFNDSHCHQNEVQTPQYDLSPSKISCTDVSWLSPCPSPPFQLTGYFWLPPSTQGTSYFLMHHRPHSPAAELLIPPSGLLQPLPSMSMCVILLKLLKNLSVSPIRLENLRLYYSPLLLQHRASHLAPPKCLGRFFSNVFYLVMRFPWGSILDRVSATGETSQSFCIMSCFLKYYVHLKISVDL